LLRHGEGMNSRRVRCALGLSMLVALVSLVGSALASSRSATSLQPLSHQVLVSVNRFRVAHGRGVLHESEALDRAALRHSLEMGRLGYFSHNSADGRQFWQRIRHFYPAHGYSYWAAGENLVWASSGLSASGAMTMWSSDAPHLANLLSRQWRQIGISAVGVTRAPGVYGHRRVTIITADFGVRR